jgi:hypothetical protein
MDEQETRSYGSEEHSAKRPEKKNKKKDRRRMFAAK